MRIVVTGTNGQLVQSLLFLARSRQIEVIPVGRPDLDLLRPSNIFSVFERMKPDVVVSAAAYTAVDRAESEPEIAAAINSIGAEAVAEAADRVGVPVIHLSTDYVFDGKKDGSYRESDVTGPLSVYGRTKLDGENRVAAVARNHTILRTAWVYSPFGSNFLKSMLRIAETQASISVVGDQFGCPTSALDIADAIFKISDRLLNAPASELNGVFHVTGSGEATWAEFAKEIFVQSDRLGGPSAEVVPIASEEYNAIAVRPRNSRLSAAKLLKIYGTCLPEWRDSLGSTLRILLKR